MTKKNRKYLSKNNKKSTFFDNHTRNINRKGDIKDNGKLFLYLYEAGQSVHLWNQISTQDRDSGQKKGRYIARKYLNGN